MLRDRTLRLQFGHRLEAVCVLGTRLSVDVFGVKHSQDVSVEVITHDQSDLAPANGAKQWALDPATFLQIQMTQPSATWTWGPDGQGAILLVNCDKENPFNAMEDYLEDMSRMILRTQGPGRLPAGYEMVLHIPLSDSDKIGVFYLQNPFFGQRYIHILGRRKLSHVVKYTGGSAELEFFVEGLRFPDESFDGLVSVHVSLLEPMAEGIPQTPIFTDTVVFRVMAQLPPGRGVQSPVELYSDWLTVGHVDEFVTFVPIPGKKQFRMLMASPSLCYKFFREKQKEGHGEAIMFKGYSGTDTKRVTINKVLSNDIMVQENQYVQRCIDWNRDILKKELGLKEKDIIDLPALFKMDKGGKAMAYFPNMVNMIVLSRDLGVPKPFGPIIEGECCLEQYVSSLLEPLGLACTFIDDISSYHKHLGEVHCGTNVQRKPFAFKWWKMVP
ncbi:hypothetical protein E2320_006166 [Naja naja]|nr:hypothetical protein E2320_006166 [Naja naja]